MHGIVRTFVAVELGQDIRGRAGKLIERLRSAPALVRWVEPHHLHLTMKFLGDIDVREIPPLCQALSTAVAELPEFEIEAHGAGAFPQLERPRTIWLGFQRGAEELTALHERLEAALAPLGFRQENRRFRPHLTLGRVRGGGVGVEDLAARLTEHAHYAAGSMQVSEVTLFSSELRREGPVYEPLHVAALGG